MFTLMVNAEVNRKTLDETAKLGTFLPLTLKKSSQHQLSWVGFLMFYRKLCDVLWFMVLAVTKCLTDLTTKLYT